MTPKEQAKYYLDQTRYHPEDYAARDVIQTLLGELESIEATTGALKVCHSLRDAVMTARKQAAEEIILMIIPASWPNNKYIVSTTCDIADKIREKFGLEI